MTNPDTDPHSPRRRLYGILRQVLEGDLSVEAFCGAFEQIYNFEINRTELSLQQRDAFDTLFDRVVWYSPFEEERARVPQYLGDDEIMSAVRTAVNDSGLNT